MEEQLRHSDPHVRRRRNADRRLRHARLRQLPLHGISGRRQLRAAFPQARTYAHCFGHGRDRPRQGLQSRHLRRRAELPFFATLQAPYEPELHEHLPARLLQPARGTPLRRSRQQIYLPDQQRLPERDPVDRSRRVRSDEHDQVRRPAAAAADLLALFRLRVEILEGIGACRRAHGAHVEPCRRRQQPGGNLRLRQPPAELHPLPQLHLQTARRAQPLALVYRTAAPSLDLDAVDLPRRQRPLQYLAGQPRSGSIDDTYAVAQIQLFLPQMERHLHPCRATCRTTAFRAGRASTTRASRTRRTATTCASARPAHGFRSTTPPRRSSPSR